MIPGTFLEQFFTANNSPVLNNSLNLKAPVRDYYKPMQGESVPGLYLLFNQILQNLLSGNSSVQEQTLSLNERKPLVLDALQTLTTMNNEELALSINLLGGGNMAVQDSAGTTEGETADNILSELRLKPDGRVSFPVVRVSEKHMQSSVRGVKGAKAIESDLHGLLGTTMGNEEIQADVREMNLNRNIHGSVIAELLPKDSADRENTGGNNNKPAHPVDKKIPPLILQDKDETVRVGKDETVNRVAQIALDTENSHKGDASRRSFTGKDDLTKTDNIKTKLENFHLFQSGAERANLKVENNNIMQKLVDRNIALNRFQEIEIVKDNPKPQSINLVLETEGLGKISLRVAVHNNLVKADFVAHHINSIVQIQSNLSDLFASLYREGLMPDDFSFYLGYNGRKDQGNQHEGNREAFMREEKLKIKEGPKNRHYNVSIKA